MTQLLETALERVRQLPQEGQDAIAAIILEELEDETRWQAAFARSQDTLAELGREALAEHRAGLSRPLDPDNL